MRSVNRVTFMGHVVADPELRSTKSGKAVSSFALATNNEWFDADGVQQKSVDFHRIVAWEGLGQMCAKHLKKGTPIYLEGRLIHRSYKGSDDMNRYVTEVVASKVNILKWQSEKKAVETKELAAA
jgi:single-strand DNA-binding protein